jgi:CDP-glycerol glycerophosphotransferase
MFEDVATSPILYSKAASFDVCAEAGYFWRRTPGSITHTLTPAKADDRLWALSHVQWYFAERAGEAIEPTARFCEELGFAIVDYNLRRIFFEYARHSIETRRHIVEQSRTILASVPDEAIARVQAPVGEWAMLAKHGDAVSLDRALRAPRPPKARRRVAVKRRWAVTKRKVGKLALYLGLRPLLFRLPVMAHTAVFSSYWGRSFSPSFGPPALCFELNRHNPEMRCVVFAANKEYARIRESVRQHAAHPDRITVVRNGSFAYYRYLWRAKYLFNDVNFPLGFRANRLTQKHPGQIEVQTTHGIPIKKMGLDSQLAVAPKGRAAFVARSNRYDYLVSTSQAVAETFMKSHGIRAEILPFGLPQHDVLFSPPPGEQLTALKKRYGLDPEKRIVLYAPTFRNKPRSPFPYLLDVHEMQRQLGDEYQVVFKIHPLNHTEIGLIDFRELTDFALRPAASPFVKLMGEVRLDEMYTPATLDYQLSRSRSTVRTVDGSINELMFVADAVISDYSSLMYGYTHLHKPLVLFTPDIDHYNSTRGSYLNVDEVAPGAVAKTTGQVVDAIQLSRDRGAWNERYGAKRCEFIERFLVWDRGDASRRILAELGLGRSAV